MQDLWIIPSYLFEDNKLFEGMALRIQGKRITEIVKSHSIPTSSNIRYFKGTISPGLVDLQVNGAGGVMVNSNPTRQAMISISKAHHAYGTIAIMPTLITDEASMLKASVEAVIETQEEDAILGLHIEGPHISNVKHGAHNPHYIRPFDENTFNLIKMLRDHDITVMITVAPEMITTADIKKLKDIGAIISLGHTNATSVQCEAAIDAGISCATHLFNAMSPMSSRSSGAAGVSLTSDIYMGLICDGYHVDDHMIKLALACEHPQDRIFLVSDSMATVGGPDYFSLYNENIILEKGRLVNEDGFLAGAHTTLGYGICYLTSQIGLSLEKSLKMALTTPAELIGRSDLTKLKNRDIDDVILFAPDNHFFGHLSDFIELSKDTRDDVCQMKVPMHNTNESLCFMEKIEI